MRGFFRLVAVGMVFGAASIGWMILGGVTSGRNDSSSYERGSEVAELWGAPQQQRPPELVFHWKTTREDVRTERDNGRLVEVKHRIEEAHQRQVGLDSTLVRVKLDSDLRRRGLYWASLYDVDFAGAWTYQHREPVAGELALTYRVPDPSGLYDGLAFVIDDTDVATTTAPVDGAISTQLRVQPGQTVKLAVRYRSRGTTEWSYKPADGVATLRDFRVELETSFKDIDFPASSLSPSTRDTTATGWRLTWAFDQAMTGHSIGMVMPTLLQPGELAAELSFSAPISLLFFFMVLYVLATLRGLDIHPMNYLFLAAAFFAFHLLFAYTADRLPIEAAFALASTVSMALVTSYLRLVVSTRFAVREAALAQLVYLVGFSAAHFAHGFTGLAVTLMAVATLFLLMQLTGRVRWSQVLAHGASAGRTGEPVAVAQTTPVR